MDATCSTPTCNRLKRVLSDDERARADRFLIDRHRRRFVLARGMLRSVLSHYLGCRPAELRFDYGRYGKPRLAGAQAASDLRFNVSHSGDLALMAFVRGRDVGVDVEFHGDQAQLIDLARRYFTPGEARQIAERRPGDRELAFFTCWARKEAVVKALGFGLTMALDCFEVAWDAEQPARLVWSAGGPAELADLTLVDVSAAPTAAAALAVRGEPLALRGFTLGDSTGCLFRPLIDS